MSTKNWTIELYGYEDENNKSRSTKTKLYASSKGCY